MVRDLGAMEKYGRTLRGERLSYLSFVGTSDWEDYATLAFTAMQTESLADLDRRLELLNESSRRIEQLLSELIGLLRAGDAAPGR
jgi:hypothetical protein